MSPYIEQAARWANLPISVRVEPIRGGVLWVVEDIEFYHIYEARERYVYERHFMEQQP